tara:strand:- start:45 stop:530 length:486 start_codon:yes stop_codon:yes gene_type:complete
MASFIGYLVRTNFNEGKVMGFIDCIAAGMVASLAFAVFKATARANRLQKELNWLNTEPMRRQQQAVMQGGFGLMAANRTYGAELANAAAQRLSESLPSMVAARAWAKNPPPYSSKAMAAEKESVTDTKLITEGGTSAMFNTDGECVWVKASAKEVSVWSQC